VPQQVFVHAGAHLVALAAPFGELLFILGRTFAGFLFSFSISAASAISSACAALLAYRGRRIHHQLENFIFGGGDFFFRELDLVQQSFVLLVGFNVKRLIAILGNLSRRSAMAVSYLRRRLHPLDGGLSFFQLQLVSASLCSMARLVWEVRRFRPAGGDCLIRLLQVQQVFYFWKHPGRTQI